MPRKLNQFLMFSGIFFNILEIMNKIEDVCFGSGVFRLFLASIVFISHSTNVNIGRAALPVFFFLSGHLIYIIYKKKYLNKNNPIINFYLSRILRIFPIFILITILFFLLNYFLNLDHISEEKIRWLPNYIIIGFNFFNIEHALIRPAWSLEIELIFYIILPFFYIIKNKEYNLYIFVFLFLFFLYELFFSKTEIYFGWFFFFWCGIVSCKSSFKIDKKVALFFLFSFFLVIIITLFLDKDMNPMLGGSHPSTFFLQYNKYFNLFISFLLIPFAIHGLNYKSNNNFDRFLGKMSYPLYLGHWITVIYISRFSDLNFKERLLSVLFPCALTYFACFIIIKYYDVFFENLRKKIN